MSLSPVSLAKVTSSFDSETSELTRSALQQILKKGHVLWTVRKQIFVHFLFLRSEIGLNLRQIKLALPLLCLHQRSNCVSGLVRFVRTWEAPKHISLVVSETYIMSDHNSRTGLFLDTLHPSDNVTLLKS